MIHLSKQQWGAVEADGHAVVTACPGSGKTRVLTARVLRGLTETRGRRQRVAALTFTNKAADEIRDRIDRAGRDLTCLWSGTLHSFALQWILRPYAPYLAECQRGFGVADEFVADRILAEERQRLAIDRFERISTRRARDGGLVATGSARVAVESYKVRLRECGLIDYDDVLYRAYQLLEQTPEIGETLSSIFTLFCVDEVQDLSDLQFGVLSRVVRSAVSEPVLFFVGDSDQSIYESLGATPKGPKELATEFGLAHIEHFVLTGNYRSTQRVLDLCREIRPGPRISAQSGHADERGLMTFANQTLHRDDLADVIASRITNALAEGVTAEEICVLAPQWWHVVGLARSLAMLLPAIAFDAPGMSPLRAAPDNPWFLLSKLLLGEPSPGLVRARSRWATRAMSELASLAGVPFPENASTARRFLRLLNSLRSAQQQGLDYLREVFSLLLSALEWDSRNASLDDSLSAFLDSASDRISKTAELPTTIEGFRRMFMFPAGVVVNTCAGVKGQEYDTVIAFGLLEGYIPHWNTIIEGAAGEADEQESKMLYVVASRAKRRLHLIAESGRVTQSSRRPYKTSPRLAALRFAFDT